MVSIPVSLWVGRLLGLALMVALVPGWYQLASAPRWIAAALGLAALSWLLEEADRFRIGWGTGLLGLAVLSLFWAPQPLDGVGTLWRWSLLAAAFVVGMRGGAEAVYEGAAWGLGVNSLVVLAQIGGWQGVPTSDPVAGLFVNKNFLAEAALPVAVWAVWKRRWLLPLVLPALFLPSARAAMVIGAVSLVWPFSRVAALALGGAIIVAVGGLALRGYDISGHERLAIWRDAARGVTAFGHGIGQFYGTYPEQAVYQDTETRRPFHAHSDYLEVLYELGPFGLAFAVAFLSSLLMGGTGVWFYVLRAVAVDALVAFPFQNPASGVLALLAAGALHRERSAVRGWSFAGAVHAG